MSAETDQSLSLSNLARPEIRANPYSLYERIRLQDPVHWDAPMGFWVLTRYNDVVSVLHDTRFSKAQGLTTALNRLSEFEREEARPVYRVFSDQMLYADASHHARLRGLVNKAFTPRVVERMKPHIQRIVDDLLDAVHATRRMDAIREFAYPLPVTVIMEMLGLPLGEREQFKRWSDDFAATLGVVRRAPGLMDRARQSLSEMHDYICDLHDSLHINPKDDLLSALATVEEQGDMLNHDEMVANVVLLLVAGHETTTNLIGNGLLALLQHPDQMQKLKDAPALLPAAVEEILRYDSAVQIVWRVAGDDVEIGGRQVGKGDLLNLIIGAANRDPAQFPEPDRLDLSRTESRHMAFSLGSHFCLGAPLARLEGEIAFHTVLRRMPELRLQADALEWQENPTFRGVKALPLAF